MSVAAQPVGVPVGAPESEAKPKRIFGLLQAPSVIVLLLWMIVPLAMTIYFSFVRFSLLNPDVKGFAGIENYQFLWQDESFWPAILNTILLIGWVLVITVVFGVLLANLDEVVPRMGYRRMWLGLFGFAATFAILTQAYRLPYPLLHDGFFMPLFGCMILGLAGINPLAKVFGLRPLVFVGEASYCLYLLHFNLWNMIHDSHVLDKLGLARFDPWISYLLLIGLALAALHFVEKPAQRILRGWMHVWR